MPPEAMFTVAFVTAAFATVAAAIAWGSRQTTLALRERAARERTAYAPRPCPASETPELRVAA